MGGPLGVFLLLTGLGLICDAPSLDRSRLGAGLGVLLLLMGSSLVLDGRAEGS